MTAETTGLPVLVLNAKFASKTDDLAEIDQAKRAKASRLLRWKRQEIARKLIPSFRVAKCCRVQVADVVQVLRSKEHHSAHYGKLSTCASVWVCPVCSAKITERKRTEIASALASPLGKQYSKFIVTTTLQHKSGDNSAVLVRALKDGKRQFTSGGWYQRFSAKWQIVGGLYGNEFTYGKGTGCHFHTHDLIFSELAASDLNVKAIRDEYSARFVDIMSQHGFYVSAEHGVAVEASNDAGALYVAKMGLETRPKKSDKWGIDWEMAKGALKVSKGDRFTPFELLDLYQAGDTWAGEMFKEFAQASKGLHQLRWGRGMRAAFGLGVEMTDEEIASAELDRDVKEFYNIARARWQTICKRKLRGFTLEVAKDATEELFESYLAGLEYLPEGMG